MSLVSRYNIQSKELTARSKPFEDMRIYVEHVKRISLFIAISLIALGSSAYTAYALYYSFQIDAVILIIAVIVISVITLHLLWNLIETRFKNKIQTKRIGRVKLCLLIRQCLWILIALFVTLVIIFSAMDAPENLISLCGILSLLIIAALSSSYPANIPWKVIFCGCLVQQMLAIVVMKWDVGNDVISWIASLITWFLNFAQYGAKFVFGTDNTDHSFAMAVMPVLCFFMAVTSLLSYLGILQKIIKSIGICLRFFTRVTKAETFVSVAAIFLGPDTPIVMIKSMLRGMTISQLHTLFCTSLATIDAGMFPVYESMGISADQLVSASLMSAPAAIVFSKLLLPETNKTKINRKLILEKESKDGLINAYVQGASASVSVIGITLAVLIVYISLLDFANATLTYFGQRIGIEELTVQLLCSYVFLPLTFLMGVTWEDCPEVARLIGTKTIVNEYVAYAELAELINNRQNGVTPSISIKSETIATYALCGYSNIGTVGFMVGFLSSFAPNKKGHISKMGMRALVAGSFACFSTACSAGLFYHE